MKDIEKAKELLTGGVTFSVVKGDLVYTDTRRGISPLMSILERDGRLDGFSAADKVVGRAAAFLYVKLGVKDVYAEVISSHALAVLRKYGVKAEFGKEVPAIINREGTGYCPMESAVKDITELDEALTVIKTAFWELTGGKA